jgi:hypothetical protein
MQVANLIAPNIKSALLLHWMPLETAHELKVLIIDNGFEAGIFLAFEENLFHFF